MATRKSVYVSRRVPFEGPPSPNQTRDLITCEMRLFFPPNADFVTLQKIMLDVVDEAMRTTYEKSLQSEERKNVWLRPPLRRAECAPDCNWLESREHAPDCQAED